MPESIRIGDPDLRRRLMARIGVPLTAAGIGYEADFDTLVSNVYQAQRNAALAGVNPMTQTSSTEEESR